MKIAAKNDAETGVRVDSRQVTEMLSQVLRQPDIILEERPQEVLEPAQEVLPKPAQLLVENKLPRHDELSRSEDIAPVENVRAAESSIESAQAFNPAARSEEDTSTVDATSEQKYPNPEPDVATDSQEKLQVYGVEDSIVARGADAASGEQGAIEWQLASEDALVETAIKLDEVSVVETKHEAVEQVTAESDLVEEQPVKQEITPDPQTSELISGHIEGAVQLEDEQLPKVETFVLALPELARNNLAELIQNAEPEKVEAIETLTVTIAVIADRLHVLALDGRGSGEEALQIEAVLRVQYAELLTQLGVPAEEQEDLVGEFLQLIYSEMYSKEELLWQQSEDYDPMREKDHWRNLVNDDDGRSGLLSRVARELVRMSVQSAAALGR